MATFVLPGAITANATVYYIPDDTWVSQTIPCYTQFNFPPVNYLIGHMHITRVYTFDGQHVAYLLMIRNTALFMDTEREEVIMPRITLATFGGTIDDFYTEFYYHSYHIYYSEPPWITSQTYY